MASEIEGATTEADGGGGISKSRRSIFKRFRKKASKKQPEYPVPTTPEKVTNPDEYDHDGGTDGTTTPPLTPAQDGVPDQEFSHNETQEFDAVADRPQSPLTKDGLPVVASSAADDFLPSDVREHDGRIEKRGETFLGGTHEGVPPSPKNGMSKAARMRSTVVLKKAPTAKEAAFGGPPRYDWIDIVSGVGNRWRCYGLF
mmetsp:Transcript_44104/g.134289  ORF Transcript_44104/g.134289 Transcript_44104/m.134289 type:complete len:200 (-) Transcript_44104:1060-1659(-)